MATLRVECRGSNGKLAAGLRFATLMGGIQEDALTDVGDGQAGQYLAFGDNMQNATSDAWFDADYLLLSKFLLNRFNIFN